MSNLPKKFPEYLILYRTLTKKIQDLEQKKRSSKSDMKKIQKSIEEYGLQREKIKKMFPDKFFENLEDNEKF